MSRPPTRRYPLGEATRRVNNTQSTKSPLKASHMPHHESLAPNGLLQRSHHDTEYVERGYDDYNYHESPQNPRVAAITKEECGSNRDSIMSTTSTNSDTSRKLKSHIGPWTLGKTLGKGSTARVRLARHKITGQKAAIKIVQKQNAQMSQAGSLADLEKAECMEESEDGLRRMPVGIEREVAIMKLIQHPNIMKLYDIWENRTEM
jgi:serine/threonine-protein kinase HSL1 (negative regulator of Swe1 kinase)